MVDVVPPPSLLASRAHRSSTVALSPTLYAFAPVKNSGGVAMLAGGGKLVPSLCSFDLRGDFRGRRLGRRVGVTGRYFFSRQTHDRSWSDTFRGSSLSRRGCASST